jgi:hypothetical protein
MVFGSFFCVLCRPLIGSFGDLFTLCIFLDTSWPRPYIVQLALFLV